MPLEEALRSTGTAGLGKLNLVAVVTVGKGLLLKTLRYADELRSAGKFFDDIFRRGRSTRKWLRSQSSALAPRETAQALNNEVT